MYTSLEDRTSPLVNRSLTSLLGAKAGYEHTSDRLRSVCLLPERKRQFGQPPRHPIRFDVRKVLSVHARCPLVGAALGIGMCQDVFTADLVVQGIEAITGFRLRFRV